MNKANMIERYESSDRINHWVVAISFILLAMSGLALFHPVFFWLTNLFGSGTWARILHPFIGLVMFAAFAGLALRFWRQNYLDKNDEQWLKQWQDVINNREDKLPEVGRYNAGQKVLFWLMVGCLTVLLLSGIVIWRPYFAPVFDITVIRIAVVLHALAAFLLILGIIVHVYAAIWVKGSVRAMMRGYVTPAWAKKHHSAWYKQVTGGSNPK